MPSPSPSAMPTSVALAELAIAAGAVGESLTVCYQGLPATVLCQLYKHCIRYAGAAAVRHVRTARDVRGLVDAIGSVSLAIVYNARLVNEVAWSAQMAASPDGGHIPLPAILCGGDRIDLADHPGASLTVHGDESESANVTRCLSCEQTQAPTWASLVSYITIREESLIAPIISPGAPHNASGLRCVRDWEVLRALVVGSAVTRAIGQSGQPVNELELAASDYEHVRGLLQSRVVCPADQASDPLAAAMVARANVFLGVKYAEDGGVENPFNDGNVEVPRNGRRVRDLVLRREVADLGNPNCRLIRRLLEYLKRQPDGYERFRRLGLSRRPPDQNVWQAIGPAELCEYLRAWSAKQVRTHFDQLLRDGYITAEREHGNGPWRYGLPEELAGNSSAFRRLPRVEDLVASP